MEETNIQYKNNLKEDSRDREKIINEVNTSLGNYSKKLFECENKIKKYEIMEIKYINTKRELDETNKLYEYKLNSISLEKEEMEKELFKLKKNSLTNSTVATGLKSIVQTLVKEYGIDKVVDLTDFTKKQLEKYIE